MDYYETLRAYHDVVRTWMPPDSHTTPRFVHLHPDDFAMLCDHPNTARQAQRSPTWASPINAVFGLDVIIDGQRPTGTFRITDSHGCLIRDSRSPA